MAKTNAGLRIRSTRNPFKGMSMADMKKKWSSMSPEQRAANVQTFRDAAKSASKSKPKASKPAASKPKTTKTSPTTSKAKPSTPKSKAARMPPNPPSPTVTKKGSKTGAAVDPRERSLRKNRQEAKRGSTSKGRANIRRMVNKQSGSSTRNQRQVEERRRRARAQGAKRNRRLMLSRRYNDS